MKLIGFEAGWVAEWFARFGGGRARLRVVSRRRRSPWAGEYAYPIAHMADFPVQAPNARSPGDGLEYHRNVHAAVPSISQSWGDVATWVSAVATLGMLVLAVVVAIVAWKTFGIESQARKREADTHRTVLLEHRERQAVSVSAWVEESSDSNQPMRLMVRNASESPVYACSVIVFPPDESELECKLVLDVLPPGNEPRAIALDYPSRGPAPASSRRQGLYRPRMVFTDACGIRWSRSKDGRLSELAETFAIWSDDRFVDRLNDFAARFFDDYEVRVKATSMPECGDLRMELDKVRVAEDLPEVIGGPHDWMGYLHSGGLIAPIFLTREQKCRLDQRAMESLAVDGRLYGLPNSWDAVALIRNTSLAPDPPETLDQAIAQGAQLVRQGRAVHPMLIPIGRRGDAFHMYPLLTAAGGRLFARADNGDLDPSCIEIDSPASRRALERFAYFAKSCRWSSRMTFTNAIESFAKAESPFLICASGGLAKAQDARIPCEVTPVPPDTGGCKSECMTTVGAFFFPRQAPNRLLAQDFIVDYLAHYHSLVDLSGGISVLASDDWRTSNPQAEVFLQLCRSQPLMPSHPRMAEVWTAVGEAELRLIQGRDPRDVAHALKSQLESAVHATP